MFYDLERPLDFVREVAEVLDDQGIWVFEQSYMPLMLERNSYDTVCHEHLEYYCLQQIHWMLSRSGLKIVDVEFNDINGGSFSVTAAKSDSAYPEFKDLRRLIEREITVGLDTLEPYLRFSERVDKSRTDLVSFVRGARNEGKRVACLGASTKGNVVLQYCCFSAKDIEAVAEVNPDKFGCFTPGSLIPIVDEQQLLVDEPDYLIVLPWHFRSFFLTRYRLRHARLVFPLPEIEVIEG
jgi:NDP-4-keto-2,6-dideoxyhexose 3-C-methyltransferase